MNGERRLIWVPSLSSSSGSSSGGGCYDYAYDALLDDLLGEDGDEDGEGEDFLAEELAAAMAAAAASRGGRGAGSGPFADGGELAGDLGDNFVILADENYAEYLYDCEFGEDNITSCNKVGNF